MRHFKSERLKKLEAELRDLEQWQKLGLVPKKDETKHSEEIKSIRKKIEEEMERLQFLKESGDWEEYVTPKRNPSRAGYTEMPTIPDLGSEMEAGSSTSSNTTEEYGDETSTGSTTSSDEETSNDTESGSFFGRRKRWEGIIDPEGDAW